MQRRVWPKSAFLATSPAELHLGLASDSTPTASGSQAAPGSGSGPRMTGSNGSVTCRHLRDRLGRPRLRKGPNCTSWWPAPASSGAQRRSAVAGGSNVQLVRLDELLLAGAREMHADAGAARAARLPTSRVELGRLRQVAGLHQPFAVGERHRRPGARIAQANLSRGLQVVVVVLERAGLSTGDELSECRQLARLHRLLDVGPLFAVGQPLAAPELCQQDVALGAQLSQLALDGPHARADVGEARLDLGAGEPGQVNSHCFAESLHPSAGSSG